MGVKEILPKSFETG